MPENILVLGPLPQLPSEEEALFPRGEYLPVLEIVPGRFLPLIEDRISLVPGREIQWQRVQCGPEGQIDWERSGAFWLAAILQLDSRSEVEFHLEGATKLFCNGEDLDLETDDDTVESTANKTLAAGWFTVYARVQGKALLQVSVADSVGATWCLQRTTPLTRFGDLDGMVRVGSLAISDDGKILVRRVSRREPSLDSLDILDAGGRLLASDLGGDELIPIAFLPGSRELLVSRSGDEGTDLLLWQGPSGPLRTVLRGEPGLGFMKISPEGRHLLFSSTAAFEEADPEEGNRRYVHLREKITDFTPVPHLNLLDLRSGARRLLTQPGDRVLDDAVFSADGQEVFYSQTLPAMERPWFQSEIHGLNLTTGKDRVLARFSGGWEVRPQGLAASPDGKHLLFLGPPEEVGGGRKEHNVYNKQVWILDLATGEYQRLTTDTDLAFDVGGGLPRFDERGRLLVQAVEGSNQRLVRLDSHEDWALEVLSLSGKNLESLAVSPDGGQLLYTASSTDEPESLYRSEAGKKGHLVEEFNRNGPGHHLWCSPVDASFLGPGGETIEAWFYPPLQNDLGSEPSFQAPAAGAAPLVVYYYAGAVPTLGGFNGTHQFFAANGYGVLVVNPRGAYGFGEKFADFHAGDWGPLAAEDIISGTEKILERYSWLDREGIGIYGGSYGGFMTEYLVTATDLFAAAVSMYGISDLATYWGQGAWGWTYGDMALAGATPWDDSQFFIDHSPLFRADRINTPLLLLHGADDSNVTPGESDQLFTALSVLGKAVEMVVFPGEGHGISDSWENRVQHRTMILEWFDRYCKKQPEAWAERWE